MAISAVSTDNVHEINKVTTDGLGVVVGCRVMIGFSARSSMFVVLYEKDVGAMRKVAPSRPASRKSRRMKCKNRCRC